MSQTPRQRFILLGASNLTLGFPLVVYALTESIPEPVEIVGAHGHGRSFLRWSYALHRGLPGITDCALWQELQQRPATESVWGLVTDIGNDLIYGSTPDEVMPRVHTCFERLAAAGASTLLVPPPTQRLLRLSENRYHMTKRLFFPGPTRPWKEMQAFLKELNERLLDLADKMGVIVVSPSDDWYGIDPIHIRGSQRVGAWRKILNSWPLPQNIEVRQRSLWSKMKIWSGRPSERSLFQRVSRQPQPAIRLSTGTHLFLY